jgi:hypothetical protein
MDSQAKRVNQVINAFTIPLGILRGSIYRAVRGSVYNVWIAPNYPTNHTEYKVTESLWSFMSYNYFCAKPILSWHVSPSRDASNFHPSALAFVPHHDSDILQNAPSKVKVKQLDNFGDASGAWWSFIEETLRSPTSRAHNSWYIANIEQINLV